MEIVAHNKSMKMYHARFGYNKLFGLDVVKRKAMKDAEAVALFDSVWDNVLGDAVRNAEVISYGEARGLPKEKDRSWVDCNQEHRRFRILDGLHVAQLRQVDANTLEMTNLWFIASSNPDPPLSSLLLPPWTSEGSLRIKRYSMEWKAKHGERSCCWIGWNL